MSRKTPTLELLQNADIASPVRRSSRIAQNQKSSAPVVTRRASADTKTTTIKASDSKKPSRRLSLSQEPGDNSESGRSTPVFVNNDNKTQSTRKRKDSTSSLNDGKTETPVKRTSTPPTRRSTRSMSRSPQKSEETSEPTTKSRSRHYSVTEKLKPLEAIREMEAVKETVQHEENKENEEINECDKKVEITSRNLKHVKEAVVILNPITKDSSCSNNLNVSDKQNETREELNKDTNIINVIKEQENNVIVEENGLNEIDIKKYEAIQCNTENSEINDKEIPSTPTTEKSENYFVDNLVDNKIEKKLSESVTGKKVEKNDGTESQKKLDETLSNGKDSNISPMKNRNVDANATFSEDQSFQFNLNISIDTALKTPEKKGNEDKLNTSSCIKENQENELPLLKTNKDETAKETAENNAIKLKNTKVPEQSPVHEKSSVEIENDSSKKKVSLCEPMDVDEYTLLDDLDDNIPSQLSLNLTPKEPDQTNENVYLIPSVKNEKCIQNVDNTTKKDVDIARTTDDEKNQMEMEKTQNKVITEDEITDNVQLEGQNLDQDNLKIISIDTSLNLQNEEIPTGSSNGQISENETDKKEENINQIKTVEDNEKLEKNEYENVRNNDKNCDLKNNNQNEDLREPMSVEDTNIDKEKCSSNQLSNNDDKEEKILDVTPSKHETTEKIAHALITSPHLNIDVQLDNKVTTLINNKFNVYQDKSDSDADVESVTDYLDNMAEEGKDGDESETNSNEIVDKGESVGYSSSDEKEIDDDSLDSSFINDNDSNELLSGTEYDLGDDNKIKSKKKQKGKEKWSRILQVDESDESLSEMVKVSATNAICVPNSEEKGLLQQVTKTTVIDDEQVVENNSALYKSLELQSTEANKPEIIISSEQPVEIETSPKKTKKRSSLSISENLSFDEIRERIEQVVDLFSSTVNNNNRKIYLNLSLNYESDSDSKEDENKLSTSLQIGNATCKRKKSRRKLSNNSSIFTSNAKPEDLEFSVDHVKSLTMKKLIPNETTELKDSKDSVNDFQPCKSDKIIEGTVDSTKKKRRSKNVEETLRSSSNKSKSKLCEESEDIKSTEKIFNDNLVILNPPKKKKKVECSEETVSLLDNNKISFGEDPETHKKNKKRKRNKTSDQENSKIQSQLVNEYTTNEDVTVTKKKDKKKKLKEKDLVENIDTQVHGKKRKSQYDIENNVSEVEMLVDSLKKPKEQEMWTEKEKAFENTKIGDTKEKDKVKILSNVLINTTEESVSQIKKSKKKFKKSSIEDNQQGTNFEENFKITTMEDKKKQNKTKESTIPLFNINPSKSNPKVWIIDDFDTPPKPSQNRKLKPKKKNNSKEFIVPVAKDFKNKRLYDSSRINRMETTQLLKKKKKQFDIKSP